MKKIIFLIIVKTVAKLGAYAWFIFRRSGPWGRLLILRLILSVLIFLTRRILTKLLYKGGDATRSGMLRIRSLVLDR